MLFRRISEHLREQNWFAVILDLAIVVVGIFLGLQVSEWNDGRQDIRREQDILERLRADFTEIREEVGVAIDEHISIVDGLVAVQTAAAAGAVADQDLERFLLGLERALMFDPGARRSATWADVVSSGQTGLLRNAALRSALSHYDELHQGAKPLYQQFWEGQRLHEVVFTRYFDYEIGRGKMDEFFLGGRIAGFDIDAMASDPQFMQATQRLTEYQTYYQFWHLKMARAADAVLAEL